MTKKERLKWELIGIEDTVRMFNKLPEELQDRILPQAMRVGAKHVQALAKAKAPVKTGWLRDHIVIGRYPKSKTRRNWGANWVVAWIGFKYDPEHYYGHFVEYGTKYQPPRPFMRPALKASQATILDVVRKAMNVRLPRFAKKYEIKGIHL